MFRRGFFIFRDNQAINKGETMKKVFGVIFCTLMLMGSASIASAGTLLGDFLEESGIESEVSASLDFYDKYVWRGQTLDPNGVVQPGLALTVGGFELGLWGSYEMEGAEGSDEQDWWIAYSFAIDAIGVSVGHTWYDFPELGSSSKEFYVSVSYDTLLSPTVTLYHDYEDGADATASGDGNYIAFDVSHSFMLNEEKGITLDLALTYGIYDGQWYDDGSHITPSIGLTIPITDSMTVSPVISYNRNQDDLGDAVADETYVGVSVGYSS